MEKKDKTMFLIFELEELEGDLTENRLALWGSKCI